MSHVDKQPQQYFLAFDLVRIGAALLVLLNHFAEYPLNLPRITAGTDAAFPFLSAFEGLGAVGVEIFFVISGFVIAASASRGAGLRASGSFISLRMRRIFPALWISGVVAVLARATVGEPLQPLLLDFARSSVLSPIGPYIDGVVWSLVVEAFFYILVSIAMLNASPKRLVYLAFGIGTMSVLYNGLVAIVSFTDIVPYAEAAKAILGRFPFKVFLLTHGVFFALGMMVWAGKSAPMNRSYVAFNALCGLACIVELFTFTDLTPQQCIVKVILWLVALGILVASANERLPAADRLSSSSKRRTRFLGALSYPLYLNHYTVGMVVSYHFAAISDSLLRFSFSFVVVLLVSLLVLALEKRIHKAISRKVKTRPISAAYRERGVSELLPKR